MREAISDEGRTRPLLRHSVMREAISDEGGNQ